MLNDGEADDGGTTTMTRTMLASFKCSPHVSSMIHVCVPLRLQPAGTFTAANLQAQLFLSWTEEAVSCASQALDAGDELTQDAAGELARAWC